MKIMPARMLFSKVENLGKLPTAIVVGGGGFIGSFLCERLLDLNTRVFCFDILKEEIKENLKNCLTNKNFSFVEQNLNKPAKESLRFFETLQEKIDYIFYLSGAEDFLEKKEPEMSDFLFNSVELKNFLELALKHKAKFLFLSAFNIYNLSQFNRLLEEKIFSFYSFPEIKKYGEALVSEYFKKYNLDCRIVRITDVFGPRMNLSQKNEIGHFFSALIFNQEIKIPGEGLKKIYPTYVFDLIEGISRAMFKKDTAGKVFNLIGKEITLIDFSYLLKKINPELRIVYTKEEESLEIPLSLDKLLKTAREINWQINPLDEAVEKTKRYYQEKTDKASFLPKKPAEGLLPPASPQNILTEEKKRPKKFNLGKIFFNPFRGKKTSLIFTAIILLILTVFLPVFSLLWHSFWGYKNLREIEEKRIVKNLEVSAKKAKEASNHFSLAQKSLEKINWLFNLGGKENTKNKFFYLFLTAKNSSDAAYHVFLAGNLLSGFFRNLSGEFAEDLLLKTTEARLEIKEAEKNLLLVIAGIKDLKKDSLLNKKFNLPAYEKRAIALRKNLEELEKILDFIPFLLGQEGRKTYLVLFQNNMELRPAGGFIGSFGLITFEEGKMIDFKIEDVYTADGQLKGKVNPPDEILHYLGQPNWYLRDSNFSPDFPLSAKRAAWFLEKELGFLVDGVIGIDLSFAQKLLAAVGEIEVLDYKEKVNAQNLFVVAEKHSEKDFFPGSTQKKNFLTALGKTLFDRIIHSQEEEYFSILSACLSSLKEKHLLLYFDNEDIQTAFLNLGFAGEIKTPPKGKNTGKNFDYLMVVDANFSANKANYFVEREIKHEVTIGKEYGISEKVTINYKNNSPTDTWPAGKYKNYLRIIVPQNAVLDTVDIGEGKKPKLISALTEEEIKNLKPEEFLVIEATESARKSWGVLIEVPIKKSKSVTFSYYYKEPLSFSDKSADYSLYLQKQPGAKDDRYELIFGYPAFLKVKEKNQGTEKPQLIIFETRFKEDEEFRVRLEK